MIYELAIVASSSLSDEQIGALTSIVDGALPQFDGEVILHDDWGLKTLAQPTASGIEKGRFLYFIYKGEGEVNVELARLFKINEGVIKTLVVRLGENDEQEALVKAYKSPLSKNHTGSVTDEIEEDSDKGKRRFSRRRRCWFTANQIKPDWKDPKTYGWLVNEFGKISPARVSGIKRNHQRNATLAIKRARQIGVASNLTNYIAE